MCYLTLKIQLRANQIECGGVAAAIPLRWPVGCNATLGGPRRERPVAIADGESQLGPLGPPPRTMTEPSKRKVWQ